MARHILEVLAALQPYGVDGLDLRADGLDDRLALSELLDPAIDFLGQPLQLVEARLERAHTLVSHRELLPSRFRACGRRLKLLELVASRFDLHRDFLLSRLGTRQLGEELVSDVLRLDRKSTRLNSSHLG